MCGCLRIRMCRDSGGDTDGKSLGGVIARGRLESSVGV